MKRAGRARLGEARMGVARGEWVKETGWIWFCFYTVLGECFGFKRDLAMGTWLVKGCRDHRMEWKELEKLFAIPDSNVVTTAPALFIVCIKYASNRPANALR